ncbi:phage major capsid protein, partial [Acinetobacter variabilis]
MPNGNLTLPRSAGGATASYTGEGKDAKTSESKFDDVKLSAKTMMARLPILNEMHNLADIAVLRIVPKHHISPVVAGAVIA